MVYATLAEKYGWTPSEIGELPVYQAYCLMGGYGPDQINLRLGENDKAAYLFGKDKRRKRMKRTPAPKAAWFGMFLLNQES